MGNDIRLESVSPDDPQLKLGRVTTTLSAPDKRLGDDPKSPDYECEFHHEQMKRWFMLDALWDGTEGMRRAGKNLMPRYDQEHQDTWQRRLDGAVLLNYFRKTVQGYVGKPFGKPMTIPEDLPAPVLEVLDDVDQNGTSFDLFAQQAFEKAMCKGIIHAVIDFPPAEEGDTALEEAKKQPVVCMVMPEDVIGARCDQSGRLTQVRIRENTMEPNGPFGDQLVQRIRMLEPGKWTLYRKAAKKWVKEDSGKSSMTEIPFVTFYVDREGFMRSRPPLLDLAYKNVEHWVSSSDQRNILTVSRFPILYGYGVNPQDPLTLGPNSYFGFRDPAAGMKYVEHSGNAIGAGRQDLEDLKAEMAVLGLTLLLPQQPGQPTATGKAIDGAEAITELQRIVLAYEVFINEIVYWVALWQGVPEEKAKQLPKVTINSDYTRTLNMEAGITALMSARGGKDISRKALVDAMKRRGILPADFDADEDKEELDAENASRSEGLPPVAGNKFGLVNKKDPEVASGDNKDMIGGAKKKDPPTKE